MAIELHLGEIGAGQLQNLVGLAQFANLAVQLLDALLLGSGRTAYFSPSWTAFQADRGRDFSVIVDGISD